MTLASHEGGNPAVDTDYFLMVNETVPTLVSLFIGDISPKSSEVNPLCRRPEEISGLSPQLVFTGGAEFARRDSEKWAEMCHNSKVECKLIIEWGQLHVYALGSKFIDPETRDKTDNMILEWIKGHVQLQTT